jgi:hypothetical protein
MRIVRLRSIVPIGWDSMAETRKVAFPWSFDSHKVKISSIVENAADSRTASNDKLPSLRLPGCPVEHWGTALVVSSPSKPMPSSDLRLRIAAFGQEGGWVSDITKLGLAFTSGISDKIKIIKPFAWNLQHRPS